MGFSNNPKMTWSELERRLSGRAPKTPAQALETPRSRHREEYVAPPEVAPPVAATQPYAELHCHTNFSFLDGASSPEELAEEAARLGIEILAVTEHDYKNFIVQFEE
jgi:error-prone DNA polymerase